MNYWVVMSCKLHWSWANDWKVANPSPSKCREKGDHIVTFSVNSISWLIHHFTYFLFNNILIWYLKYNDILNFWCSWNTPHVSCLSVHKWHVFNLRLNLTSEYWHFNDCREKKNTELRINVQTTDLINCVAQCASPVLSSFKLLNVWMDVYLCCQIFVKVQRNGRVVFDALLISPNWNWIEQDWSSSLHDLKQCFRNQGEENTWYSA